MTQRKPKSERRRRTALVAVRFMPAELEILRTLAAQSDISVSAYIRNRALANVHVHVTGAREAG